MLKETALVAQLIFSLIVIMVALWIIWESEVIPILWDVMIDGICDMADRVRAAWHFDRVEQTIDQSLRDGRALTKYHREVDWLDSQYVPDLEDWWGAVSKKRKQRLVEKLDLLRITPKPVSMSKGS